MIFCTIALLSALLLALGVLFYIFFIYYYLFHSKCGMYLDRCLMFMLLVTLTTFLMVLSDK